MQIWSDSFKSVSKWFLDVHYADKNLKRKEKESILSNFLSCGQQ